MYGGTLSWASTFNISEPLQDMQTLGWASTFNVSEPPQHMRHRILGAEPLFSQTLYLSRLLCSLNLQAAHIIQKASADGSIFPFLRLSRPNCTFHPLKQNCLAWLQGSRVYVHLRRTSDAGLSVILACLRPTLLLLPLRNALWNEPVSAAQIAISIAARMHCGRRFLCSVA